jgi:DNA repair protein RecN (Recombination protein N)
LVEPRDLLETAAIHAGEAAASLRHYLDGLEVDPAALEAVETRIAQIHDLARKFRVLPVELPDALAARQAELETLEQADLRLGGSARVARHRAAGLSRSSTRPRGRAGGGRRAPEPNGDGGHAAARHGGRALRRGDRGAGPRTRGAGGLERIAFLVSANPGQPLQPLAKVASGGELSRISLGIQVATAECGSVPTLVFDEVDVGIGGGSRRSSGVCCADSATRARCSA